MATGRDGRGDDASDHPALCVTIFRSRLRSDSDSEYPPAAERMERLAAGMSGFLGIKTSTVHAPAEWSQAEG